MPLPETISELLQGSARDHPESTALGAVNKGGLSYSRLHELTQRSAATLAGLGLRREDRIAIVLPNGPEMASAFLSVARLATAAPLNPSLKEAEYSYYLKDLDVRAVIVSEIDRTGCSQVARGLGIPVVPLRLSEKGPAGTFEFGIDPTPSLTDLAYPDPTDVALVLHTSGTTASPKIVPLSHANLCHSAGNVAATLRLVAADTCLNVMPLFHIHGLVAALLASLTRGAAVVCSPGFLAPRFFEWFDLSQPTWYTAVPTMHQAILARAGEDERVIVGRSPLRLIRSSSASLPPSVLRETEEAFGVPVIEAYGMTEAAHQMTSNPLPPLGRKPGSVGPAAGPEVAVLGDDGRALPPRGVGEVVIRGTNVTKGYHGVEDQRSHFLKGGWFRTGDQGYLDEEGYLFLTGRLKEIINRGGETIAPREIDEALLEHPEVLQAVAFSVPDQALGEEVAAAVVLEEGSKITEALLQGDLADRLSYARLPKRILVLPEIPKGSTGKIQRIGLAEKLGLDGVEKVPGGEGATPPSATAATLDVVGSLWREVLNLPEVKPDDLFIEVGGDSVTATELVVRVEERFSVEVPLLAFFQAGTISAQASLIDSLMAGGTSPDATDPAE